MIVFDMSYKTLKRHFILGILKRVVGISKKVAGIIIGIVGNHEYFQKQYEN